MTVSLSGAGEPSDDNRGKQQGLPCPFLLCGQIRLTYTPLDVKPASDCEH
jgi:hypothetical protein